MLTAWLIGFGLAFAGSMPTAGPTGILVLTWGLGRRYDKGVAVAVGAALPEAVYASLAFLGFSVALQRYGWVEPASQVLAVLVLAALGALLVTGRVGAAAQARAQSEGSRGVMAGPLGAFGMGFGIATINPALLANWSIVVALAHATVGFELAPERVTAFAVGVVAGIVSWFGLVLTLLARYGDRFDAQARGRAMRWIGGVLIGLAALLLARVAQAALG